MNDIEQMIRQAGNIQNIRLERKWLVSEVLKCFKSNNSYEYALHEFEKKFFDKKPYSYSWETLRNELKRIVHIYRGREQQKRLNFFNINTLHAMINDYTTCIEPNDLNDYEKNLIDQLGSVHSTKHAVYCLDKFIQKNMHICQLPKSKVWEESFKRSGAYNTIEYLVRHHDAECDLTHLKQKTGNELFATLTNLLKTCNMLENMEAITNE